jgi:hypothetical protein
MARRVQDITCAPSVSCMPLTTAPDGGRSAPSLEDIKANNATSFWARWTGADGTASLQTGRGNRLVTRSLRDAREDAVCMVWSTPRHKWEFHTQRFALKVFRGTKTYCNAHEGLQFPTLLAGLPLENARGA